MTTYMSTVAVSGSVPVPKSIGPATRPEKKTWPAGSAPTRVTQMSCPCPNRRAHRVSPELVSLATAMSATRGDAARSVPVPRSIAVSNDPTIVALMEKRSLNNIVETGDTLEKTIRAHAASYKQMIEAAK